MNRQTYPVRCGWCGGRLAIASSIKASTGICPACARDVYSQEAVQARRAYLALWRDEAPCERREIIANVPRPARWDWDSFLIGTAFGVLVFIFLQWLIHFH